MSIDTLIEPAPCGAKAQLALSRLTGRDKRNALDLTMRAAIAQAVGTLDHDSDIRAIVITGNDMVFAAGADLNCSSIRARRMSRISTLAIFGCGWRFIIRPSSW